MPGGAQGGGSGGGGFDYGAAIGAAGDLFGAVGSYLGGQSRAAGLSTEAAGYGMEMAGFVQAEQLEDLNIAYAAESGRIQDIQTGRKIYKSISGAKSDIANAGLAESGNVLDVLRSSAEQGALQIGMQDVQTAIQENTYREQALAYHMEATQAGMEGNAAAAAAAGAGTGGVLGAIGGILSAGAKIAPMIAAI